MDMKNAVVALGIHELCANVQELGEKVHELSEKPMVSILIS